MSIAALMIENLSENVGIDEFSWNLGRIQMAHFVIDRLAEPLLPVAWIGGVDGGVQAIAKIPSVHAFDLAQMFGMFLARLEKRVDDEVEVDLRLFQLLLEGANDACSDNMQGRMSGDAKIHLNRLLNEQRFSLTGPRVYATTPYSSHAS